MSEAGIRSLTTVIVPVLRVLVIVHVFSSPTASVPEQSADFDSV